MDLVIYLDMDGVIADYEQGMRNKGFILDPVLAKELNRSKSDNPYKRKMYDFVKGTEFYRNLPMMDGASALWERVKKFVPIFLTASPKFGATEDNYYVNPYWLGAAYHKRRWLEDYFLPQMNPVWLDLGNGMEKRHHARVPLQDETFICTTSARKQEFMHRRHGPHQVLIDDRIDNCRAWAAAGGYAILYIGAEDAIQALDMYEKNPIPGTFWNSQDQQ